LEGTPVETGRENQLTFKSGGTNGVVTSTFVPNTPVDMVNWLLDLSAEPGNALLLSVAGNEAFFGAVADLPRPDRGRIMKLFPHDGSKGCPGCQFAEAVERVVENKPEEPHSIRTGGRWCRCGSAAVNGLCVTAWLENAVIAGENREVIETLVRRLREFTGTE
jgi:hypothetical protein